MAYPTLAELKTLANSKRIQESLAEFNKRVKSRKEIIYPTSRDAQSGLDNCNAIVNGADFHVIMADSSGEY